MNYHSTIEHTNNLSPLTHIDLIKIAMNILQGIVCSGVAYYVQGLVTRARGPVFVTAFQPLCMIITAVLGSTILKEEITLGR